MPYRLTSTLTFHSSVADAWALADDDSRFHELVEDIRTHGIVEPIWITDAGEVVDGRHRLRAARIIGLESVPVQILPPERDPAEFAISVLCARRHLSSKGQVAYAAYLLFENIHRELVEMRTRGLRQGSEEATGSTESSVDYLAAKLGISIDTFQQAAKLHRLFRETPDLRAEWEPKIMTDDGPIGLGAAIAGIAGQAASAGRSPSRNSHLHRALSAWDKVAKPAAAWSSWTNEERDVVSEKIRLVVAQLPEPVLDVLSNSLRSARRSRDIAG